MISSSYKKNSCFHPVTYAGWHDCLSFWKHPYSLTITLCSFLPHTIVTCIPHITSIYLLFHVVYSLAVVPCMSREEGLANFGILQMQWTTSIPTSRDHIQPPACLPQHRSQGMIQALHDRHNSHRFVVPLIRLSPWFCSVDLAQDL